jgi:hypothetical protein
MFHNTLQTKLTYPRLCLRSGALVACSPPRRPRFENCSSHVWDLCWPQQHWTRLSGDTFVSLANLYSTNFSTIIAIYHPGPIQHANKWSQYWWTMFHSSQNKNSQYVATTAFRTESARSLISHSWTLYKEANVAAYTTLSLRQHAEYYAVVVKNKPRG